MKNVIRIENGKLPMQFMLIGFVLIVLSIFFVVENQIIGAVLVIPGIFIIAIREGVLVDNENKSVFRYIKIFVFEKKELIDFSEVKYLSMVKVNVKQTMNVLTISNTQSKIMRKVNLIFENNKHKQLFQCNLLDALEKAKLVANITELKILNLTHGKEEWINPTKTPVAM